MEVHVSTQWLALAWRFSRAFKNASGEPAAGKERHIVLRSTEARETLKENMVTTLQQDNDQLKETEVEIPLYT
jgi:hypothetical protein